MTDEVPHNVFRDPTPAPEPKTVRKELNGLELEELMNKTEMERYNQLKEWGFNLKKPITSMEKFETNGIVLHQEES